MNMGGTGSRAICHKVNSKGANREVLSLSRLLVFEVDGRRTEYVIWGV